MGEEKAKYDCFRHRHARQPGASVTLTFHGAAMMIMILLASSCRGPCCSSSAFETKHSNVVIDHVRTAADAIKLVPLAKPDLVVLGPDVPDTNDLRSGIARAGTNTRLGVLACNQAGPESAECLRIRADFMAAVAPMLRAAA